MQETWVQSLGWEDSLEKEIAAHSRILAWEIPWAEETARLNSMMSQRVGHDWSDWARKHVHLLSIINGYHWDKFSQLRCHLLRRSSWPLYSKYPIPLAAVAAVVLLSHVWLFLTSWAIAPQVPLSMGFPRQEFWSELPFPSPGNLPDPRIRPISYIGREVLYHYATWEAQCKLIIKVK